MIYVFPYNSSLEAEIDKIAEVKGRLRAFPALQRNFKIYSSKEEYPFKYIPPKTVEKVILDSGAFALSQTNHLMDNEYMIALDQYFYYNADKRSICVAPDVFRNPSETMINFKKWHSLGLRKDIAPVIQNVSYHRIDLKILMYQADFYRKYSDVMLYANSCRLTGECSRANHLQDFFKYLKKELKVKWIHVLGAGWNLKDIEDWKRIGYFDSMDSFAYYSTSDCDAYGSDDAIENIKNILKITGG